MNDITKKIIVCLVLNQLLRAMPDTKERMADVLGQDTESLNIELFPEAITATGIAIVWQAVSSVIDWRILAAIVAGAVLVYYITKRCNGDTKILTDTQLYNISKRLLA